ncbi:hypothetical protein D3C85_1712570 [compost metagenome]
MSEHLKVLAAIATGEVGSVDGYEAKVLKELIMFGYATAYYSGCEKGDSYIRPEVTPRGNEYLEGHYAFA